MLKITVILLIIACTSPLYARSGPQQFTVTHPDGTQTIGEYVPDTGQVIVQSPQGFTVMQQEPGNRWQVSIEPPREPYDLPVFGFDSGDD